MYINDIIEILSRLMITYYINHKLSKNMIDIDIDKLTQYVSNTVLKWYYQSHKADEEITEIIISMYARETVYNIKDIMNGPDNMIEEVSYNIDVYPYSNGITLLIYIDTFNIYHNDIIDIIESYFWYTKYKRLEIKTYEYNH